MCLHVAEGKLREKLLETLVVMKCQEQKNDAVRSDCIRSSALAKCCGDTLSELSGPLEQHTPGLENIPTINENTRRLQSFLEQNSNL